MKKQSKAGKRLLALLSVFAMGTMSMLTGVILTIAQTDTTYAVTTTEMNKATSDTYEPANWANSLLRNADVTATAIAVDKNGTTLPPSASTNGLENLTSGAVVARFVSLSVSPGKVPLYISYNMGQNVTATGMAVIGDGNWGLGQYELYIGNSRETLFTDSANKVLSYTNSTAGSAGDIKGYFGQTFTITGDTKPTGSFFGIKIISENIQADDYHLRFRELMLYGIKHGEPIFDSDYAVTNMTKPASASFLTGKNGVTNHLVGREAVCLNNLGTVVPPADPTNGQTVKMVDNSLDTRFYANVTPVTAGDPMPVTISYDMGKTVSVDEMAVMGYSRLNNDAGLWKYNLYVSDTRSELFTNVSLVFTYRNEVWDNNGTSVTAGYFGQSFVPEAGKEAVKGRYFGIKILTENNYTGGENTLCIGELAVYGGVTDTPAYTATVPAGTAAAYLTSKASETNHLAGKPVSFRTSDSKNATLKYGSIANMTNGVADTGAQCASVEQGTSVYPLSLTYDMRENVTISELAFISRSDLTDARYPLAEYEVFVSDNSYDLYSLENQVVYYDNAANVYGDTPVLANVQVISFPQGKRPTGRYYGVRFLRGEYAYNETRVGEAAVYGTATGLDYTIGEQTATTNEQLSGLGTNLLTGYTPTVKDATGAVRTAPTNGVAGNIVDGNLARASSASYALNTPNMIPMTFAFQMTKQAEINKLFVAGFMDQYTVGEYEIYVSTGATPLFSSVNRVAGYSSLNRYPNGTASNDIPGTQVITLNTPRKGAYIGFKILQPDNGSAAAKDTSGNSMTRLIELGAYGIMTDLDPEIDFNGQNYIITETINDNASAKALGTNMLAGLKPTIVNNNNINLSYAAGNYTMLTSGDVETRADKIDVYATNAELPLLITYNLGKKKTIDAALVVGHYVDWGDFANGEYELYASDRRAELFNAENKFAYCNNAGKWRSTVPNSGRSQYFQFDEKPSGRYFGIKILRLNAEVDAGKDNALRINELGLYGRPYVPVITPTPSNLIANMPLGVYQTDLVGRSTQVDSQTFTTAMQKKLTDGVAIGTGDTVVAIPTNGKQLDLLYDISTPLQVNTFTITGAADASRYIGKYKIYAASSMSEVWKETSLVTEYDKSKVSSPRQTQQYDFSGQPVSCRFIRLSVEDTGTSDGKCYFSELSTVGLDMRYGEDNVLFQSNVSNNVKAYITNMDSQEILSEASSGSKNGDLNYLFDGDTYNSSDFWGAEYGKESLDLVVKFDTYVMLNKMTITSMSADTIYNYYNPREIRYYVGNSEEELFGSDAVAVGIYQDETRSKGVCITEIAPTIGRYLRISLVDSCVQEVAYSGMIAILDEIEANGIVLDETSSICASFQDEATGLKLDVYKNGYYDLFNEAAKMVVTRGPLTNTQKGSLAAFDVKGFGDAYKVGFYDRNGYLITNWKNRQYKVTLPIPTDLRDGKPAYFGHILGRQAILLEAAYVDNQFVFTENSEPYSWTFVVATDGMDDTFDPDKVFDGSEDEYVLDDFEGYDSTFALNAAWMATRLGNTSTLEKTTDGQRLKYSFNKQKDSIFYDASQLSLPRDAGGLRFTLSSTVRKPNITLRLSYKNGTILTKSLAGGIKQGSQTIDVMLKGSGWFTNAEKFPTKLTGLSSIELIMEGQDAYMLTLDDVTLLAIAKEEEPDDVPTGVPFAGGLLFTAILSGTVLLTVKKKRFYRP